MRANEGRDAARCLVVDGDPDRRRELRESVETLGFLVEEAADGPGCQAAFQARPAQVVLFDATLVLESGAAICQSLRLLPGGREAAVVLVHPVGDCTAIDACANVAIDEFLERPTHPAVLGARLRSLLRAVHGDAGPTPDALASASEAAGVQPSTELVTPEALLDHVSEAILAAKGLDFHVAIIAIRTDPDPGQIHGGSGSERADGYLETLVHERLLSAVQDFVRSTSERRPHGEVRIAQRNGGGFAILVPRLGRIQDAAKLGTGIQDACATPFLMDGNEIRLTISVGVSTSPTDGVDAETVLKNAETACYCAKQEGPESLQFFTEAMSRWAFERLTLEHSLRDALEKNELVVYYQPRVEIATKRVVGMEALVRWKHPQLGMVSPAQFIPLAEETGLIVPIGEWVLEEACRQNKAWQDDGLSPIRISVNLSAVQFRQAQLHEMVSRVLQETGLQAEWLELELTESMLMNDLGSTIETLKRLKSFGIHLSIDDFGTGYSSLSYLRRFPIDALKIDRSFIREVTTNTDDAAIATSIILMGNSLRLTVVAEGVEDESQLAFLQVLQCNEAQGFLFSPPVPAEQAARFIGDPLDGRREDQLRSA